MLNFLAGAGIMAMVKLTDNRQNMYLHWRYFMKEPLYWNHNTVYYKWIKQQTVTCKAILDVGCGDGSLVAYLDDGLKSLTGIDVDSSCISRANLENKSVNTQFMCCDFDDYATQQFYDAIIFVASIHHMEMRSAIEKSKLLLAPNGMLIIVGLAAPSTVMDYVIEGLRILPCKIISTLKHMQSSENQNIPVSYKLPSLHEVRDISAKILPNAAITHGLYYRYLLKWTKQ